MLRYYFPASAANLATDYAASLDGIADGRAKALTPASRHFDSAAVLDAETMNARIWLGFHFRKAMTDANRLGHRTAQWTITHEFRPVHS